MKPTIHHHLDSDGIAHLVFDLPGAKVNTLSAAVLDEFDHWLDVLADDPEVRLLTIASAKPTVFIAGADLTEIAGFTDPHEATTKAARGQAVLQKLADFPRPTVAVINGACLGGGLELALACTYRLATTDAKTVLGLPEVTLGFVPGFGGTQRLPALIGLPAALQMILTGKPVKVTKALKLHLVDQLTHREFLYEAVTTFCELVLTEEGRQSVLSSRQPRPVRSWLTGANPLARAVILSQARKRVMAKTGHAYPAPLAAIALLQRTHGKPLEDALAEEAKAFGQLATTAVSANLVNLFFLGERVRKERFIAADAEPVPIQRPAVVGAGVMGGGIACLLSSRELPVRLKDVSWEAITKGYQEANATYTTLQRLRKIDARQARLNMLRIAGCIDYTGFATADLVIEAVVEDAAIKRGVYAELEERIAPTAIIASNTSTIPIEELARNLRRPERFAGLHFFNPVSRMPLVEIIAGPKTSQQTVATLLAATRAWGKQPIVVKSCPGFLVNRLLMPYLSEAIHLLVEGVNILHLDHLMTHFGWPMGPARLLDEIGLDVARKVAHILDAGYDGRMPTHPFFDAIVDECHLLGRKSKAGLYVYDADGTAMPNPEVSSLLASFRQEPVTTLDDVTIRERLLYMMVNEAARCLSEEIVGDAGLLDMALVLGTGFPPHQGGLLRYADSLGATHIHSRLSHYQASCGPRFTPAPRLIAMHEQKETFHETDRQRTQAGISGSGRGLPRNRVAPPQLHG